MTDKTPKIAIVYDWINKIGGAERILTTLHEIWPEAPFYTSVYHKEKAFWAGDFEVRTSFLQKILFLRDKHELVPFLMPLAFESFNFDGFDIVISVTSSFAKGIITKPETLHLCYCLTPTRYLWSGTDKYLKRRSVYKNIWQCASMFLRGWDYIAGQRPDVYVAISKEVQRRIKKYYRRDSKVIYPPLGLAENGGGACPISTNGDYFLIVSRLVAYKRIDLAIEAFNQSGFPLKIIGVGGEEKRLKKMAKANIEFLGELTDEKLCKYYQNCKALVFPSEEDFGLVSLEAQFFGKPVIAFRAGGTLETLSEGKTGEFFYPQTAEALFEALKKFEPNDYNAKDCQKNAQKFKREIFKQEFKIFVKKEWKNHLKTT